MIKKSKFFKSKIFTTIAVIGLATSASAADTYKFDPNHTAVIWEANHFGFSNPSGKFTAVDGVLVLDEKNPKKSSVEVTIKIASLETGLPKFNEHLKSKDFLNAEKFPTAKFVSKKIELNGKNKAKITGDLTIVGVTKPVVLNVKLNKIGAHPFTKAKAAGFSANTIIKRSEFGIDYAIPGVADEVKISIEAEAAVEPKE